MNARGNSTDADHGDAENRAVTEPGLVLRPTRREALGSLATCAAASLPFALAPSSVWANTRKSRSLTPQQAKLKVEAVLKQLVNDTQQAITGVSAACLQSGGQPVHAWAGWRQVSSEHPASSLPIGAETFFRVASISKLAQALACMRLHEAGLLRLDEDLAGLWGDALRHPVHPHLPITARLLLTHRSGLLDRVSLPLPSGEVLRRTLSDRTQWGPEEPGRMFRYSNFGCAVLATVMEAAAGEPYDRLMQHRLFEPLGLRARFSTAALTSAERQNLATLYRRPLGSEAWVPQADLPGEPLHPSATPTALAAIGENASVHSPAGGLRASMDDLLRMAEFIMAQGQWQGRQVISRRGMAEMLQPHWTLSPQAPGETFGGLFRSWSLGMQRFTDTHDALGGDRLAPRGGITAAGHVGMAYGLFSGLMVLPQKGRQPPRALAYVVNGTSQGAAEAAGRHSSFRRFEERVIETLLDVLESTAITG